MWKSFDGFVTSVLYDKFISYNQVTATSSEDLLEISKSSPRVADHLKADMARMLKYRNNFDQSFKESHLSQFKQLDHSLMFYEKDGPSFPPYSVGGNVSEVLKDFYPVILNDDFKIADAIMLVKSRISRFIKGHFERHEYRIKKCDFFIYQAEQQILDIEELAIDDSYAYAISKIRDQIQNSPDLIESQIVENSDLDLDGEASSNTERAIAESSATADSFISPGDAQKIIYRGLLFQRSEKIASESLIEDLETIRKIQNPAAEFENS